MSLVPMITRLPRVLVLVAGVTFPALPGASGLLAQELPPAIEVDRLLLQVEDQIRNQDHGAALATLDRVLELEAEHDLETPVALWFKHAQVALEAGSIEKARGSVGKYLELTGQDGEYYRAALRILNQAEEDERQLGEDERLREETERLLNELYQQALLAKPDNVFRDCAYCPVMVKVPVGSFMMGSSRDGSVNNDEWPQYRVTIASSFAVGVYEVTFAEWDTCVRAGGCEGYSPWSGDWGQGRHPVADASWEDAATYVRWLSRETGEGYRLLSEAEWEYVARAGTQTEWYWGESESEQCQYANGTMKTFPARMVMSSRRRWARSDRTASGCTTCWATCGNGRRTV